jgi:hypothetical protein
MSTGPALVAGLAGLIFPLASPGQDETASPAIERATAFLAREVSSWRPENGCFSCHNTGDGARALALAASRGLTVPPDSLGPSLRWLERPADWDGESPPTEFDDPALAHLQYASALLTARQAGLVTSDDPLRLAADLLIRDQDADGSFHPDGPDTLGGPTTYGRELSTWLALRILESTGSIRAEASIRRAREWLAARPIRTTEQAAVALLTGSGEERRALSRQLLADGQAPDGGWGPYASSPPEVFDTALALQALQSDPAARGLATPIERGRAFLLASQEPDGGWPETTRPTGGESYSQRISTTAWALIALLETQPATVTPPVVSPPDSSPLLPDLPPP